jgi:hypothetical protein
MSDLDDHSIDMRARVLSDLPPLSPSWRSVVHFRRRWLMLSSFSISSMKLRGPCKIVNRASVGKDCPRQAVLSVVDGTWKKDIMGSGFSSALTRRVFAALTSNLGHGIVKF